MRNLRAFSTPPLSVILVVLSLLTLCSCGSDDDSDATTDILGTWSGVRTYYNPAGGQKYQYLTMTFQADGMGKIEYEAPTSISVGYFTYTVSNQTIYCRGANAASTGDFDTDFQMSLKIQGDRLLPLDKYSQFVLTRDGSVMTDGDGNEVVDLSSYIPGVWVARDKTTVAEIFEGGDYTEYILDSPGSNTYSSVYDGTWTYDAANRWLTFNGTRYHIYELHDYAMAIEPINGKMRFYDRGSKSDIPKSPNIEASLESVFAWSTKDNKYTFRFVDGGTVIYFENSNVKAGSFGYLSLAASGTYSIKNSQLTCYYPEVDWEYSSSYPNAFPGWTAGTSAVKTYTISLDPGVSLRVEYPDGTAKYFYPY